MKKILGLACFGMALLVSGGASEVSAQSEACTQCLDDCDKLIPLGVNPTDCENTCYNTVCKE